MFHGKLGYTQRVIQVQDAFSSVIKTLRDVLHILAGKQRIDSRAMDVDDKDGFGPIRTTRMAGASAETQHADDTSANRCTAEICISFLTLVPILQSSSGEPTRDKELTDLVLDCADTTFFLLCPIFLDKVHQRVLNLNTDNLENLLYKLEPLLRPYPYSQSEGMQLLVTQFLHSTLPIWLQKSVATTDLGRHIRQLAGWLCEILKNKKIRYWRVRDSVIHFLDGYLTLDPFQEICSMPDDDEGITTIKYDQLPAALLPFLVADEDIRVRVRAGVASARLFSLARQIGQPAERVYLDIKEWLTREMDKCVSI
jgi:serine-protein kinase ATM